MSELDLRARFEALDGLADDSDWQDVLVRAGLARKRRIGGWKLALLVVSIAALASASTAVGLRLHSASAAPPGPRHVQRHVRNGTIHWLFAHEPRGQSLSEAHIPLLTTVGSHWQPVKFARVITPDARSHVKIVLSLIGKRGRNICMTVLFSSSGGGGCAFGLLLKPFSWDESSHMDPNCSNCGGITIAGLASDDVARMELFLPGNVHRPIPLKDNVFLVTVPLSTAAMNLVAYDKNGLVIGASSPPRPHALR